jgi:hypothetical protein
MKHANYDAAMEHIEKEMRLFKNHFPFRIVWSAVHPETFETMTNANPTKRQANDMVRKGWHVYVCDSQL